MGKLLTKREVAKKVSERYNLNEYSLISDYINSKNPITLKHNKCGTEYTIRRSKDFFETDEYKCPLCYPKVKNTHSTKKLTENVFIERLKNEVNDEYTYISGFSGSNGKLLLKHNICGNIYETTPHYFLGSRKRRCPFCANKNRGKYALKENYLQTLLNEKEYGNEFEWLEEYKGSNKEYHLIRHKNCGLEFSIRPNDFQQGYGCPACNRLKSKEELEVFRYIQSIYDKEIIQNFRYKNLEIDIYLPDLKIAFEYNGTYYHSDKFKDSKYHLNKKELFLNELGINIVYINEIDWILKKDIWKSKIAHLIYKDSNKKIFARNTKVVININKKLKKKFLNKCHLQGNCNDTFNLALIYENKIVAIMTFGFNRKSVNNNKSKMELIRYATSKKYIVVGGFSKLLKHSMEYIKEKYPEYKYIYTFADRDISLGDVYLKNGFSLDHISKPSYFFVYKNKKYNRYAFRKDELKKNFSDIFDKSLTEAEITSKIKGLYKIYNCGNYVYKIDIK